MRRTVKILFVCLLALGPVSALADQPATDALKQALTNPGITIEGYAIDGEGLNAFYAAREYSPAWNFAGAENGSAFNGFLNSIDQQITWHGLVREDYAIDLMRKLASGTDDASHLNLELLVTDSLLRLAHDLHGDSVSLATIYPGWKFKRAAEDIPVKLAAAVASNSVNEYFESLTPKNPAYRDLAGALTKYREMQTHGEWTVVEPGPALRPKDHGQRVSQLRARLAEEDYLPWIDRTPKEAMTYDDDLRQAVIAFQNRNGLDDGEGRVGNATLAALNVPLGTRIDQIRANMERWRHMTDDYPPEPRGIVVNIADASVVVTDDGKTAYRGPVIVGQVERKTPFIQSIINSMIINPAWHVPQKIAKADILPKLRDDPKYLEKQGIVIRDNEDDPHGTKVDWKNMSDEEFNFRLRQQPGKMNSLGRLKFDFDNSFAVYLHGTPHQELFSKTERTLSSGCVRLRDPELVAEIVLEGTGNGWDVARIEDTIASKKTRWIELKNPMPIDIVYWTVFTDESGQLQFRNDVYDYDRFLMENMKPGVAPVDAPSPPVPVDIQ